MIDVVALGKKPAMRGGWSATKEPCSRPVVFSGKLGRYGGKDRGAEPAGELG